MLESILELKIYHDVDMEKKSSKFGVWMRASESLKKMGPIFY